MSSNDDGASRRKSGFRWPSFRSRAKQDAPDSKQATSTFSSAAAPTQQPATQQPAAQNAATPGPGTAAPAPAAPDPWSTGQPTVRWLNYVFEDKEYDIEYVDGDTVYMVGDDGKVRRGPVMGPRGPVMAFHRRSMGLVSDTPIEYPEDLVWRTRWDTPIGPVILINNRSGETGFPSGVDEWWEIWVTEKAYGLFPRGERVYGSEKSSHGLPEDDGPPGFKRLVLLRRPADEWCMFDVLITGQKDDVRIQVVKEYSTAGMLGGSGFAATALVAWTKERKDASDAKWNKIKYNRGSELTLLDGGLKLTDTLFIQALTDEVTVYDRASASRILKTSSSALLQEDRGAWAAYRVAFGRADFFEATQNDSVTRDVRERAAAAGSVLDLKAEGRSAEANGGYRRLCDSLLIREAGMDDFLPNLNSCHLVGDCLVMFRPSGALVIVQDYADTFQRLKGLSESRQRALLSKHTIVVGLETDSRTRLSYKFASFRHRFAVSSCDRILLFDTRQLPKCQATPSPLPYRAIVDVGDPSLERSLASALAFGQRMGVGPLNDAEDIFMDDRALYVRCPMDDRHREAYERAREDDPELEPWDDDWKFHHMGQDPIGVRAYDFGAAA